MGNSILNVLCVYFIIFFFFSYAPPNSGYFFNSSKYFLCPLRRCRLDGGYHFLMSPMTMGWAVQYILILRAMLVNNQSLLLVRDATFSSISTGSLSFSSTRTVGKTRNYFKTTPGTVHARPLKNVFFCFFEGQTVSHHRPHPR